MIGINAIAEIASLLGDPARANILFAMKEDGQVSSGDLAIVAGVAPSTASEHLAKLVDAGLAKTVSKGRRRYYSLADPTVAEVLEGVEGLAKLLARKEPNKSQWYEEAIHSRSCLDHLAGRIGGQLAGAAISKGLLRHTKIGPELTDAGGDWLRSMGTNLETIKSEPRRFIRLCPDWLDEPPHLGGAIGAEVLRGFVRMDWMRRVPGTKQIKITPRGIEGLRKQFDIDVNADSN